MRKVKLIGHLMRHNGFVTNIMDGRVLGKESRGRPRLSYIKNLMKELFCNSYAQMKRLAQDRHLWLQRQGLAFREWWWWFQKNYSFWHEGKERPNNGFIVNWKTDLWNYRKRITLWQFWLWSLIWIGVWSFRITWRAAPMRCYCWWWQWYQ
jgi:hypothetical protein